jgi:hypothetical protein
MRYRRSFPWIRLVVLTTVGVVYAASVAKIGPRVGDLRQSKGVVLLALTCVGALGLAAAAGAVWIFAPEWVGGAERSIGYDWPTCTRLPGPVRIPS